MARSVKLFPFRKLITAATYLNVFSLTIRWGVPAFPTDLVLFRPGALLLAARPPRLVTARAVPVIHLAAIVIFDYMPIFSNQTLTFILIIWAYNQTMIKNKPAPSAFSIALSVTARQPVGITFRNTGSMVIHIPTPCRSCPASLLASLLVRHLHAHGYRARVYVWRAFSVSGFGVVVHP